MAVNKDKVFNSMVQEYKNLGEFKNEDSGKIVQDVPQVLGHYRSRFNKPYKGNKPSELRELYTLTS